MFQLADDAVGLELVVEPWIEGLWDPLKLCLANLEHSTKPEQEEVLKLDSAVLEKLSTLQITADRTKTKPMYDVKFGDVTFTEQFPHGVNKFILPFADGNLEQSEVLQKRYLTKQVGLGSFAKLLSHL